MKLQFDPNQSFQLDAVEAVTDLFDGQPVGAPEYAVIQMGEIGGLFAGQDRTELGVGNRLLLADEKLVHRFGRDAVHRLQKTLEDANLKLASVASEPLGPVGA